MRLWEAFLALLMSWGVILFGRAVYVTFGKPRRAPRQDSIHSGREHDGG